MRYGVKIPEYELSEKQKELAGSLKVSEDFLRLLLARGMDGEELRKFLYPDLDNLSSPFHIKDMDNAARRLKQAIESKEKILIFGDYDCDGICATSILLLFLKNKTRADFFIPDRLKHGYGMTMDALEEITAQDPPDLVITVDCGITSAKEVEFLKSRGIDVIITDHHEPQSELPRCIVVDAKIEKNGFSDYCGAGVALRLVEAAAGREEAEKYLDIAAIATIADVVPLIGDNRIIAYFGLKKLAHNPRKGVKLLLGEDKINSQNVMFKLAPRMNAAGRLDSAAKVVGLFLEEDRFLLKTLAEELVRDNQKRQEICESVVAASKGMLKGTDFCKVRFIALYGEDWEAGVLGIAAARIAEEFKRPVALFSKCGGELKGSARSVRDVNIFEVFSRFSDMFISFGGHAQAAGISIKEENFSKFRDSVNVELLKEPAEYFLPQTVCDAELKQDSDILSLARELELLEPTGFGNPAPSFLVRGNNLKFEKIGFSKHIKCCMNGTDMLGFSKFAPCMGGFCGETEYEVSLGLNVFQNRLRSQCVIRSVNPVELKLPDTAAKEACAHHLKCECAQNAKGSQPEKKREPLKLADAKYITDKLKQPFGTLIVCFSEEEYTKLTNEIPEISKLPLSVGRTRFLCPQNAVVVAPSEEFEFAFYQRVVIAGRAMCGSYIYSIADAVQECVAYGDCTPDTPIISDEDIRASFREIREYARRNYKTPNFVKFYEAVGSRINLSEWKFFIILAIFQELGLVSLTDKGIISISNARTELNKSAIYRNLRRV